MCACGAELGIVVEGAGGDPDGVGKAVEEKEEIRAACAAEHALDWR
jgi:hypothetical protein